MNDKDLQVVIDGDDFATLEWRRWKGRNSQPEVAPVVFPPKRWPVGHADDGIDGSLFRIRVIDDTLCPRKKQTMKFTSHQVTRA